MIHRLLMVLGAIVSICVLAPGCGGGGTPSAPPATAIGRVLNVDTGGPVNPAASVQGGGHTTLTSLADGSFSLSVPTGTTSLVVDTHSTNGLWTFTVPRVTGTTDVGDLWVGPQRVSVQGRVLDSTNGSAVVGAIVTFAGRRAISGADGTFSLAEVAYSNANQAAFWGIVGNVNAANFFAAEFNAAPNVAQSGVVTVGDVLLTPSGDSNPPPPPYNIWGHVTPLNLAAGTIVTLKQNGTAVRIYNVTSLGTYYFWVAPGTYTISALNGSHAAMDQTVTLNQTDEVIRKDVALQ